MIPDDIIKTVKERADILKIVGAIVTLKRSGASYKGLCPFHGEKTASFIVNPQQGTYHCFGCQAHGDSLKFIRETQQLNFPEAVRSLAQTVGVMIPESRPISPKKKRERRQKKALEERLFELQEKLTVWYCQSLYRSEKAKRYLQERGITKTSAEEFRLGWASDDIPYFCRWMTSIEASVEDLITLGVIIPPNPDQKMRGDSRLGGGYLRFRDRLMCPIFDLRDRVVGYSGRVINPHKKTAKYLNSPETPLFKKKKNLYGLKTARVAVRQDQYDQLILCEGNLDVISLWQNGFPHSVAAMGTAVTEPQTLIMKRLSSKVLCMMDGDSAGQKAAFKSLPVLLDAGLDVRGKLLPDGHDPDSFLKQHGAHSLKQFISDAPPLLLTQLHTLAKTHPKDPIGQAAVIRVILPLIQKIKDEQQRPLFLDEVAHTLEVDRTYLTSQMMLLFERATQRAAQRTADQSTRAVEDEFHSTAHREAQPYTSYTSYPSDHVHFDDGLTHSNNHAEGVHPHRGTINKEAEWVDEQWWALHTLERQRIERSKRWKKDEPTGNIRIKLTPPPSPPLSLLLTPQQSTHLAGYEKEVISTLFYMPHLIAPFIEREGTYYMSQERLGVFVLSLQEEYTQTGYVSGEDFLQTCTDQLLVSEIQDSLVRQPTINEKTDFKKILNDLISRLKFGKLQAQLTEICKELASLLPSDKQQKTQLLEEYQRVQSQLKSLTLRQKSSEDFVS